MPPVGFEPTISAGEWPQTYDLGRVATGTDRDWLYKIIIYPTFTTRESKPSAAASLATVKRCELEVRVSGIPVLPQWFLQNHIRRFQEIA